MQMKAEEQKLTKLDTHEQKVIFSLLKITLAVPRKHKTSPGHNFRMGLVPFRLLPFCYLIPLGAISPTRAKCDQNNVKQFKQAVQVYKVKGLYGMAEQVDHKESLPQCVRTC